jgi:hypothetical protein
LSEKIKKKTVKINAANEKPKSERLAYLRAAREARNLLINYQKMI